MGVSSLPKTVIRQRRGCDLNPGLLRLSPARQPLGYRATYNSWVWNVIARKILDSYIYAIRCILQAFCANLSTLALPLSLGN